MSVEITETYPSLRPFKFIKSMSYEQFRPHLVRWDNEQDRRTTFNETHKMCDEVIRAKGTITRTYHYSLSTPSGIEGRLFCPGSMQTVPREIRGLAMRGISTDIDMKNAHPTILRYICFLSNIECPQLEYYINHRDEMIGTGPERETKKALFLKALNKDTIVKEIKDFSKEIIKIQNLIMKLPEFSHIEETVTSKKYNKAGSFVNKCLCIYENRILQCMRKYLVDNGYIIRCLAFDGLMIDGNHYENKQLLKDLENHINSNFEGLNMKLDYKEHDTSIVIPDDFDENTKNEINDEYLLWKKEFELTHAKIIDRSLFVKSVKDKNGYLIDIKSMTKRDLLISYEHISYNEPKETKTGMTTVKKSCIQRWITDETMLCYNEMGVYPPPLICPHNHLNIWTPFYAEMLPLSSTSITPENIHIYTEQKDLVLNHFNIMCNNCPKDSLFLKKWTGQFLKYPSVKTVAPTLISNEGAGKGTLTYLLERLIGNNKFFETTDPARYVWGSFNELMTNKFLVNCDEMDYKSQQECEGKIKGLITNNNLTINSKGVKSFIIQSYHRFLFTTNNEVPIKTHKDDRRNKIIRSSNEKIGNSEYFINLRSAINNDVVLRMVYEELTSLDELDSFHTERIEQNEYQKILSESFSQSIPEQFLNYLTGKYIDTNEELFTSIELLNLFDTWRQNTGFKYECDCAKLLRNLKLLDIENWYTTVRTAKCNKTRINFTVLRQHFGIGLNFLLEDVCETDDENI